MQPCDVRASFTPDGTPHPRDLTWEGTILPITDLGRRWTSQQGQHMLARVRDGRVFELVYDAVAWQGQVVSQPPNWA